MISRLGNTVWVVIAMLSSTAFAADEIRWAPDIPTARKAAAQFNVPLMIHFYGDNCLPCRTLEERVFSKPELSETLNKYFICVRVNATQDRQTAAEYQVHSWPTDVFVSPDGKTLFQGVCQQDFNGYMGTLQNVAVMNRDRNILLAAQKSTESPNQQAYAGQDIYTGQQNSAPQQPSAGLPPASGSNSTYQAYAGQASNVYSSQQTHAGVQTSSQFAQNFSGLPTPGQSLGQPPAVQQPNPSTNLTVPAANGFALSTPPIGNYSAQNNGYPAGNNVATNSLQAPTQIGQGNFQGTNVAMQMPGYYPPNQTSSAPQLGQSVAPGANVSSGPLTAANQPVGIIGAVQGTQQQLVGPANPVSNALVPGQLPPQNRTAQITAPATSGAGRGNQPGVMPGMPSLPSADVAAQTVANSYGSQNGRINAQLVSNPFYGNGQTAANGAVSRDDSASPSSVPVASTTNNKLVSSSTLLPPVDQEPSLMVSGAEAGANVDAASDASFGPRAEVTKTEVSAAPQAMPAIEGYCPIALKTKGQWVAGKEEFSVKHRGRYYWLSSQAAMEQFLQAPDASSPMLSGYDPLVFLEEGKLVEGDIQYGLHEQVSGSYLLFSSAEAKAKYWKDFDRYTTALNAVLSKATAR